MPWTGCEIVGTQGSLPMPTPPSHLLSPEGRETYLGYTSARLSSAPGGRALIAEPLDSGVKVL